MIVIFSVLSPYFLSFNNFKNILTASAVIGLMSVGATFVIGSGGIDLATASIVAVSGVVSALMIQDFGINSISALGISLLVGSLCGLLSGALIVITRAPSFIVTLGMLSIIRAVAYIVSDGIPIYGLSDQVTELGQGTFFNVPYPAIFFISAALLFGIILSASRFGVHVLSVGDNAAAATAMGLPVKQIQLKVYTLSGMLSGLAGFIFMARTNSGDPSAGQNYELMAITAVILGGANLFGGRASMLGTFLGVLSLGILQNGLNLLAVSSFYQILFVGLVLLSAAALRRLGDA